MGGDVRKLSNIAAVLSASAALSGALGCMQIPEEDQGDIALATHVQDWRDEVIYQVLIDRFADGDGGNNHRVDLNYQGKWHGGDWKGLEDNLQYIQDLGVTTIWISPVVKNVDTDAGYDGYHGYWAQDMTEVNPHFGDLTALRSLVRSAHERGMKIILDIVTNHLGQLFYYELYRNGQPDPQVEGVGPYKGKYLSEYDPDFNPRGVQSFTSLGESGPAPLVWQYDPPTNHVPPQPLLYQSFNVYNRKGKTLNFDDLDQLVHGDFPGGLKDLNTTRCDVKQSMVDIFVRWVELTDLDGFRIDTVKHVEHEFWRYFAQNVRLRLAEKGKTNFFMFGEAFDGRDDLIGSFTKQVVPAHPHDEILGGDLAREDAECPGAAPLTADMLDGVFYFSQHYSVYRDVFRYGQSTNRIQQLWDQRQTNYGTVPNANATGLPPTKTLVNFIDNHDVARFLFSSPGTEFSHASADPPAQLRNALLMLLTQDGIPCIYYGTEQELKGGNDPANREDMWNTGYGTSGTTFQWVQRLTQLRKERAALRRGDLKVLWATEHTGEEEDAGIFAFERAGGDAGDDYALVVVNTHPTKTSSTKADGAVMTTSLAGGVLVDALSTQGNQYQVAADGTLDISLAPSSGAVLIRGQ
jgi:alpha-amylase